jgi:hypothetical protein
MINDRCSIIDWWSMNDRWLTIDVQWWMIDDRQSIIIDWWRSMIDRWLLDIDNQLMTDRSSNFIVIDYLRMIIDRDRSDRGSMISDPWSNKYRWWSMMMIDDDRWWSMMIYDQWSKNDRWSMIHNREWVIDYWTCPSSQVSKIFFVCMNRRRYL